LPYGYYSNREVKERKGDLAKGNPKQALYNSYVGYYSSRRVK
jgi:hypothetical protein